eukprot:COSAG01_NODE_8060_length_2936_cov_1.305957_3_plen_89_part_00
MSRGIEAQWRPRPGSAGGRTQACQRCAQSAAHAPVLAAANCTSWLVNDRCYSGGDENNEWMQYIEALACVVRARDSQKHREISVTASV